MVSERQKVRIITVERLRDRSYNIQRDLDREIGDAMDSLARAYKEHNSNADIGIIVSNDIADICLSSQSFFENDLEKALEKVGIKDVKVRGLKGGTIITKVIRDEFGEESIDYLDHNKGCCYGCPTGTVCNSDFCHVHSLNDGVAYRFEKRT